MSKIRVSAKVDDAAAQPTCERTTRIITKNPRGRGDTSFKVAPPVPVANGQTAVGNGSPRATSAGRHRTRHPPSASAGRVRTAGVGASGSKENIAPGNPHPTVLSAARRPAAKTRSMGYLEMKRQHDGLLAEVRTKEAQLQEVEGRHRATVDRLTEEICQCQESNAALQEEVKSYQVVMEERTQLIEDLEQRLEEIEIENERMAAIMEGARIDAVSGEMVERAVRSQEAEADSEREVQVHEQQLEEFISDLEEMISSLQGLAETMVQIQESPSTLHRPSTH